MFRLHCNKCHKHRVHQPSLALHLSRCQHVLCAECLDSSSKDKKCPLCSLALQTIPICRSMPSGMAQYFQDPNRYLQLYRKISKFQADQRTSDNLGFSRQMEQKSKMERQLQGYNKMEAKLNQQIKRESQRIRELRDYISYHEDQSSSANESGGSRSPQKRRQRPSTPSVATDTTMSDEPMEKSFCLDLDMDFGPKKYPDAKNFHI